MFRLTVVRNLDVYLRIGNNRNSAKAFKGRRRLLTAVKDTKLEVNKNYPVDLSDGTLNILVIPFEGT